MKPITDETKALLKSGAQVGASGPNYLVELENPPLTDEKEWTPPRIIRGPGGYGAGHFVTAADGSVLVAYTGPNSEGAGRKAVYLSYVSSEYDIFNGDNTAQANETKFIEYKHIVDCKLLKLRNGKILLFVGVGGQRGIQDYQYDCYISENGLGTDFIHKARVHTWTKESWTHAYGNLWSWVGVPMELEDGTIVFTGNAPYLMTSGYGYYIMNDRSVCFRSTDGGATWNYSVIIRNRLFTRYFVKSIAVFAGVWVALVIDQNDSCKTRPFYSYDEGQTWTPGVEYFTRPDGSNNVGMGGVCTGADGFNYLFIGSDVSTYAVYRSPQNEPPPEPIVNMDSWELVGGGFEFSGWTVGSGDSLYPGPYFWITENYNQAIAGGVDDYTVGESSIIYANKRTAEKMIVKSLHVSKSHGLTSSTATIVMDNKGGTIAPDNIESPWHHKLLPNRRVTVYQGYGADLVKTFTGYIDNVDMRTFPQEIVIECRDALKKALDQTIKQITYKDMKIEDIARNLAARSGLRVGQIDATGLTISEKTFEWESYADALSWCAELVAFEYFVDEDELFYFRAQEAKETTDYIYKEGEDITKLGYSIDDDGLYRKIYVAAENENGDYLYAEFVETHYSKLLRLPLSKELKIDIEKTRMTSSVLKGITQRIGKQMVNKVRRVEFEAIANPWLEIGDALQVIETSSTISNVYRILDIDLTQTSEGFTMKLVCYYYGNV